MNTDSDPGLVSRVGARFTREWKRLKSLGHSRLGRDQLITLGTELSVMGASLLVLKLAATYAGPSGFGEYVLGRRMIGFIQLPALCGMGIALTRAVAMAREGRERSAEWRYLDFALLVTLCTSAAAILLLTVWGRLFAELAMGGTALASLARSLAPGVAGLVLHGVAYGLLRGRLTMIPANALQAVSLGLIPLCVFLIPDLSVPQLMFRAGLAQLAVSLLVLGTIRIRGPRLVTLRELWHMAGAEMLRYGAPRVPGEFVLGALNALPLTAAVHYGGTLEAGRVGLGLAFLSLIGSFFAPLGQIMLPGISAQVASGRTAGLARNVWSLTAACAGLTAIAVITLGILAPWLIAALFGAEFRTAVVPVRIITLGAVPYVLYIVLRNVLDAIHVAPINAGNLVVALLAFGLVLGLGRSASAVAPAVAVSMTVLGVLTVWRTRGALTTIHPGVAE